jgi:NitT/TauT family transport system substrate-binding protein
LPPIVICKEQLDEPIDDRRRPNVGMRADRPDPGAVARANRSCTNADPHCELRLHRSERAAGVCAAVGDFQEVRTRRASLDAGFSNITSAVSAIQRGIPIIVLHAANLTASGHADALLMKARGSKIKTGADLNGKVIAVTTLGGTLQLGAEAWIDKNGGDSRTTHFVEIPTSNMPAALKQGRIDGAMISEPFLTEQAADIEPIGDAFAAIAPEWISAVFVASKAWVTANPEAARRFVAAMHETAKWANTHHAETAKILSPLSGVPLATFNTMEHTTYTDQLTRALMQPGIDAAARYGALKAPYDTADIVTAAAPYLK